MLIFDGVLQDPLSYRTRIMAEPFTEMTYQGTTFPGMREAPVTTLEWAALFALTPRCLSRPKGSAFRLSSPSGAPNPAWIHSDESISTFAAVLYLTPDDAGQGTCFWAHREWGSVNDGTRPWATCSEDLSVWTPQVFVPGLFNRLLIFDAKLFHSIYPKKPLSERLVQVFFYD
jgi:hypothetical protein